ncbi:MAG: pilus assembly protein TadG-related protein [Gemmataceae bacterium]
MPRLKNQRRLNRKGLIAAFVAVCLVVILGLTAISLDGGGLLDRRRQAQATADAAAMAAACDLYANFPTYHGVDSGSAAQSALNVAATNGFTNDTTHSVVTVNIPPQSGPYTGLNGYVEVLVTWNQPRYFSRIWGTNSVKVTARAVAKGAWLPGGQGVLVLDYTGKAALSAQGNGYFTDTEGPVIVNSDNASAVVDGGNGALIANQFFITGGATLNGSNANLQTQPIPGQIFEGVHPTPDPLAYLPEPSKPSDGTMTHSGSTYTLTPGYYNNLPNFSKNDTVIFQQASASPPGTPVDQKGVYYIDGGIKSTGATIIMDSSTTGGVMIYNNSGKVDVTGNPQGTVTLGPLSNGPYQGITYFQARENSTDIGIQGNGSFTMTGTFYAAGAAMSATGNGGQYTKADGTIGTGSQIGSQYIVKDLSLAGNGNIHLGYPGNVARDRFLTLVE